MTYWLFQDSPKDYRILDGILPKPMPEPPDIGYWLDKSRVGTRLFATLWCINNLLGRPLLEQRVWLDLS